MAKILYWENNSAGVNIYGTHYTHIFANPSGSVALPDVGIWVFAQPFNILYWQGIATGTFGQQTGAIKGLTAESIGAPAAVLMAMERAIHRRIHGRIFGRIG